MIDTDRYEGHTPAPWKAENEWYEGIDIDENNLGQLESHLLSWGVTLSEEKLSDHRANKIGYHVMHISDAQLIADAPLILEDYKRLLKNINEYVDEVEAFHKMLKEEYEMEHKIPLCPENKDNPKEHNWVMDDWVGHRCVDCGFHWCKPLRPPKWKKMIE